MYMYVAHCKLWCRFSACSECMTLVSLVGSSLEYKVCAFCAEKAVLEWQFRTLSYMTHMHFSLLCRLLCGWSGQVFVHSYG